MSPFSVRLFLWPVFPTSESCDSRRVERVRGGGWGASLGHEGRGEMEDPLLVWHMGAISQTIPRRPSKFLHCPQSHILSGCFNIHETDPHPTHTPPLYFSHPP